MVARQDGQPPETQPPPGWRPPSTADVPVPLRSLPGDEPLPPAIGRFRILRQLGRGGMGDVFLAHDEVLGRNIAIKRIRRDRAGTADIQRRFEIEARVTSVLQHPAIVPVYQLVKEDEDVFYTMRPVEGMTFGDLLWRLRDPDSRAREEWPPARLVRLFLQAAHAVAYAHSRGVIHRDLKPANIMIGPFEEVVVLDWGMAKVLEAPGDEEQDRAEAIRLPFSVESTQRTIVGTPPYMAPQQLLGAPATVSSDVFSLGVTLYELLTLRLPWEAADIDGLYRARFDAPRMPTRFEPASGIPHDLARAVLRALEFEPEKRYPCVTSFAREVADALEGRAPWKLEERALARERWSFAGGRLEEDGNEILLRSGGLLRYFCLERFGENVRVEFEISVPPGNHELSVWLHTPEPRASAGDQGYHLTVLAGNRRKVSLLRSGRVVAGGHAPRCEPGRWCAVSATREDDRFLLAVDGEDVYVYHDPIPLRGGGFVGITAQSSALRIRSLRVSSRGTTPTVSCLAVPDAFFNRRLYDDACAEYEVIAESQPGRNEGRLAGFRAGLCLLEMARLGEVDAEQRSILIGKAEGAFSRLRGANGSCFEGLGHAMAAAARGDSRQEREAFARAFSQYPGDRHLPAVSEHLLARLHSVGRQDRRTLAELLPLAMSHCMEGWGRSVIRDLMQAVHGEWEIPSFMTGRGRFRASDRASHAEARMLLGFWTARPETIERALADLASSPRFRPHHVADAVLSLLELGHVLGARDLMASFPGVAGSSAGDRVALLLRSAVLAAGGDLEEAHELFASVPPEPFDRIHNSVRLVNARSCFERGDPARAFRLLRPSRPEERFAREHLAWFHLLQQDAASASRELEVLVERGDHRAGRNLCNFLYGALLVRSGREDEAREVFSSLPPARWPRTWTLGSHYALGRLGGGSLESYLEEAFPYERRCLARHAELLAAARGEPPAALPAALRN